MRKSRYFFVALVLSSASAHAEINGVGDALSITRRPDGKFDVVCRDGSNEIKTEAEVTANQVCVKSTPPPPPSSSTDPWSNTYCGGAGLTEAEALARIPLPSQGSFRAKTFNYKSRTRVCTDADGCTKWDEIPEWTGLKPRTEIYAETKVEFRKTPFDFYGQNYVPYFEIAFVENKPLVRAYLFGYHYDYSEARRHFSDNGRVDWAGYSEGAPHRFKTFNMSAYAEGGVLRPLQFSGHVGKNCMRAVASHRYRADLRNQNTGTVEQEFLLYAKFDE